MCEKLRSSKSRRFSCLEANKSRDKYKDLNKSINAKNENKTVYYEQNMNIGIKKKVITNNPLRPSTMASKLLQRGMKYITEFRYLKEEEEENRKKNPY